MGEGRREMGEGRRDIGMEEPKEFKEFRLLEL